MNHNKIRSLLQQLESADEVQLDDCPPVEVILLPRQVEPVADVILLAWANDDGFDAEESFSEKALDDAMVDGNRIRLVGSVSGEICELRLFKKVPENVNTDWPVYPDGELTKEEIKVLKEIVARQNR